MNNVLAVYQKELWHYFRSPIAYFVVAVFMVGTGYFFTYNVFFTGIASMAETLQSMGLLLMVVCPAITMRLFAAEYGARTMELLDSLPLRPWQIVAGKYLGALTIFLLMTVATMIDLIPLYLFGSPETTTILSGYIGFVLLGMACLALGQFFSALTENQIVAALITVSVLLGLWWVGNLESVQSSVDMRLFVRYISLSFQFGDFIRGLLRSEAVVFYLIVTGIALTLNTGYLAWRR